jgi:tetratricopeptide (TPR) repeat protein
MARIHFIISTAASEGLMNKKILRLLLSFTSPRERTLYLRLAITASLLLACLPLSAQSGDGCVGVNFAKAPSDQYSPENLQKRLARDPKDVDALINLGIHLEEVDQITEAYGFYKRAIDARPDCYLGYQFGGLVADRISRKTSSEAGVDIHRALSLNPSIAKDGNVEAFLKSRAPSLSTPVKSAESVPKDVGSAFEGTSRFLIGIGVGLMLSTPFIYLVRRRRSDRSIHA